MTRFSVVLAVAIAFGAETGATQSRIQLALHGGLNAPLSRSEFDAGVELGAGVIVFVAQSWRVRVGADYTGANGVDRWAAMVGGERHFGSGALRPFVSAGVGAVIHDRAAVILDGPDPVGPLSGHDARPAARLGGGIALGAGRVVPFGELSALAYDFGENLFDEQFDLAWRLGVRVAL